MSPISSAELLRKYSVKAGAAGNTTPGTAGGSLGRYISTTQIPDNVLNNLWDDVTGTENAAMESEYRCVFIHNNNGGGLALQNAVAYLVAETAGGANIAIGADPTAPSPVGQAGVQAIEVADENTAPAGVVFTSPTTYVTGVALGTIPAGQCKALWIRRTATASAALPNDGVTIRITGDSV